MFSLFLVALPLFRTQVYKWEKTPKGQVLLLGLEAVGSPCRLVRPHSLSGLLESHAENFASNSGMLREKTKISMPPSYGQ